MEEVYVHPTAIIDDGARIGKGTRIWHFAHVRESARIGEKCNIGKGVYLDADVTVGNRVKIQNGVSVYHGVTIEDDVFCGPHMTFTNDLYPRAFGDEFEVSETLVKKGASIGAHAVIICNTTLGEYCMVGSGAVVTKDVPAHGLVRGNPARLVGFVCMCGRPISDIVSEEAGTVKMKCQYCDETTSIPKTDFDKMVR
jgi:acetyltransferase-like isoleucine patch superfamily enzyme